MKIEVALANKGGIKMEQDWEPVTVRRSGTGHRKSYAATGATTLVVRAGDQTGAQEKRKVDETEIGRPKQLSPESRTEIIQKRVALGKNQVELNMLCRFPVNTMREIESGRLCPTQPQLNMLNRVLKATLKYC